MWRYAFGLLTAVLKAGCRFTLGLSVLGLSANSAVALASESSVFHVGLHFLDEPIDLPELPQAQLVEGQFVADSVYRPLALTNLNNLAVTQGGLGGWTEAAAREAIRFKVEQIYRSVTLESPASTLRINFYDGPAPTVAVGRRINVVIGTNDLQESLFGWSLINSAFNTASVPDGRYGAAAFLDNLDQLGLEEGIVFDSADAVFNNVAGTIAHEVGHLFGLDHLDAGPGPPYEVMAIGGHGLTPAMRLTERRFSEVSRQQLIAGIPSGSRADFNMDGDVDVFQVDGRGDAQILVANLGTAFAARLADGDANSDGDVDVFQMDGKGDAQMLVSALGTDVHGELTSAVYDPHTGTVQINLDRGIGVLGIVADGFPGMPDLRLNESLSALGSAQQQGENILAFFDPAGLTAGQYQLTGLLPTGLPLDEIFIAFTPLGGETALAPISLALVPEPWSSWLVLLAVLGWPCRRRADRKALLL